MTLDELRETLPEAQRKHLDPAAPAPARMMAAKGLVPLPPREMVIVLSGLALDAAENVAKSAQATLGKLPDPILVGAIDAGLPAAALGVLLPLVAAREALVEKIVLCRDTPDAALAQAMETASEKIAEIVSQNQERLLRSEALVRALAQNAALLKSSKDRVFDFLVRSGVVFADMPEFAEALARLSPQEMEEAAAKIELPPEASAFLEESAEADARAEEATQALETETDEAKERVPTLKLIQSLSAAQKVALALKGNKEARSILVRDTNKVVASAAIRNPRITEQEVVMAAQSRQVSEDVVRIIANSKELSHGYTVKVALVGNPKTPLPTAMKLLTLLRANDIKNIAKSKNVASALSNQAKRIMATKSS